MRPLPGPPGSPVLDRDRMRFTIVVPPISRGAGRRFPGIHELRRTRRGNPWARFEKISGRRNTRALQRSLAAATQASWRRTRSGRPCPGFSGGSAWPGPIGLASAGRTAAKARRGSPTGILTGCLSRFLSSAGNTKAIKRGAKQPIGKRASERVKQPICQNEI